MPRGESAAAFRAAPWTFVADAADAIVTVVQAQRMAADARLG
jgi:hypothetical protein